MLISILQIHRLTDRHFHTILPVYLCLREVRAIERIGLQKCAHPAPSLEDEANTLGRIFNGKHTSLPFTASTFPTVPVFLSSRTVPARASAAPAARCRSKQKGAEKRKTQRSRTSGATGCMTVEAVSVSV